MFVISFCLTSCFDSANEDTSGGNLFQHTLTNSDTSENNNSEGEEEPSTGTEDPVTDPVATQLIITAQPQNVLNGAANSITVEARDADNQLVTNFTGAITLHLSNDPSSAATLGGTTSLNAVAGVAAFTNFTLNQVGSGYQITAKSDNLQDAVSEGFDITDPVTDPVATQLIITAQPQNVLNGAANSITVEARDADNQFTS